MLIFASKLKRVAIHIQFGELGSKSKSQNQNIDRKATSFQLKTKETKIASHPISSPTTHKKKNPTKIKHKHEPHLKPIKTHKAKKPPNTQNSTLTPFTLKRTIQSTKKTKPNKRMSLETPNSYQNNIEIKYSSYSSYRLDL